VGGGRYLDGTIDEVRVWNVLRTPQQIRDNICKSMQGDETGLVAYYRMDQQSVAGQTTLYDQTPNGNNGTLTNMDATTDWVASTAFNTWIGSDSTVWAMDRNWSRNAAPVATDNAGIPDYSNATGFPEGNPPTISGGPTVNHFALATSAESTLSSDLTLNGNLLLNADFNAGANTVTVVGSTVSISELSISTGTLDANGPYDASGGSTTFTGAGTLSLFSSYDLGIFTKDTGNVTLDGTSAQTITGTFNPYNLTIDNSDSVDASGATSLKVDNQLAVNDGTFTSSSDYHHVSIADGATLALSGDITVSGNWDNAGTLTHNDYKVTLDGGDQQVLGDTTFYDLSKIVVATATLTFEAEKTTTVANALTLQGAAGQLLLLRSGTDGTQWKIDPQGTRTIGYLDVKDANNIDAANMGAENFNCVDSRNNTNWFNTSAPTATAATSITETGFTANWAAVAGASGYRLDVSTKSDFSAYVTNYQDKDVGDVTSSAVTGLSETTVYYYRVRAEKDGSTSDSSNTISVTTSDGTGVPADVQDTAPNNGDGNGDGTKDSLQTGVASLPSATPGQSYLTVEVRDGCGQLNSVAASTYASVGTADPGYTYPYELVAFTLPCATATVRIYYHGADSLANFIYRKYGPTPSDWNTSIWYSMPGVTFGTKEIGGNSVPYVEFPLTESQLGDDTQGYPIVDQGGVAMATAIPTLNEWGLILLGLLIFGAAVLRIRRQRA